MQSLVAIKPAIRCPGEESPPPHSAPNLISKNGADGQIRTDGQLFTKQLLYH